jgi:hypothetical protein
LIALTFEAGFTHVTSDGGAELIAARIDALRRTFDTRQFLQFLLLLLFTFFSLLQLQIFIALESLASRLQVITNHLFLKLVPFLSMQYSTQYVVL